MAKQKTNTTPTTKAVTLEWAPFDDLVFLENNPRTRTEGGKRKMAAGIEADPSFYENRPTLVYLVNGEYRVYAGDLRAHAAHDVLGWPLIPCNVEADIPPELMRSRAIVCKRCGVEKNVLTDFRSKNVCKECEKAKRREYNQSPEFRAKRSEYRKRPDQKAKAKALKQTPEHIARAKDYKKEYRQTDAYREYMRAYKQTDKQREYMSAYHKSEAYKAYMQTEDYKERAKANKTKDGYLAYTQSAEYKEKSRERKRRPDQKEKAKALKQTPEYKEKQRLYAQAVGGSHYRRAVKRGNYAERVKRIDIFRRDNFTCEYCKKKLKINECVVDHRIPIVKGGSNTVENCTTSCNLCNSRKNDKLISGVQISIFDNLKI